MLPSVNKINLKELRDPFFIYKPINLKYDIDQFWDIHMEYNNKKIMFCLFFEIQKKCLHLKNYLRSLCF